MSENSEINRISLANNWIAVIDAFRTARRAVTEKPLTQAEQFALAGSWEDLFAVAESATVKRSETSLLREKSDILARRAGVADSTGTRAKFRVSDTGGFAEFAAVVNPLTGAVTCGNISLFSRVTAAHAEREMRQGKTIFSDESGSYLRFTVRCTWGVTADGIVKIFNAENSAWLSSEQSPAAVMAGRMAKWVPVV